MFQLNKNSILVGIAVLSVLITAVLILESSGSRDLTSFFKLNFGSSKEVVAKKAIDFINKTLSGSGQKATLTNVSEKSGVVKISLEINDRDYNSYVTKDGKLLFPEGVLIDSKEVQQTNQSN